MANGEWGITNYQLPIANYQFPIPNSLFPIPYSQFPIPYRTSSFTPQAIYSVFNVNYETFKNEQPTLI